MADIRSVVLSLIIIYCSQWTGCYSAGQDPVPICSSRYDYESKILERMVMVEHRMNVLEESTNTDLKQLVEDKRSLKKTVMRFMKQFESELESKLNELNQMTQFVEANVTSKLDEMSNSTKDLKEEKENIVADINTKMDALKDRHEKTDKPAVAFHVRNPSDSSPYKGAILRFEKEMTNTDNVYDTSSGYFTAPLSGVYMFAVQMCTVPGQYIHFRMFANNDIISDTTEFGGSTEYHCTSTNAVAVLKKGDKVCVKTGPNTSQGRTSLYSTSYRWSTFTGALVN